MSRGLPSDLGMASSLPVSRPGRMPTTLEEVLPRLEHETELQKMLADEKMRSEQHKTNYQTLKAEHTRLQDEYIKVQNELKSTIEESKLIQEKYKSLLDQARQELASRHAEAEEAKSQVLNPQKMDMLKLQLAEDIEEPYRQKFQKLNEEVENYRTELNKLKYEHSFLKSEYEHERDEHANVIKEMKMRHEAEVANLRKERETILARQQGEGLSSDSQRVRVLQRENAQLHLKVKGLLTELEEIRAQREHLGLQSDHVSRLQNKQLQEHAANVRALETERESLKQQVETLQKELASTSDLHTELTGKVHSLEKENVMLRNQAEEVQHKSKVELTNLRMEMLKERGDLERDRDRLLNQIEDFKSELDIAKHSIDQQAAALVDKEREVVKQVQAAREEEWQKLHKVENEKLELESKLQEIERKKIDEESQQHAEREKTEEKIRVASEAKETAEKELLVIKTKLQHLESLTEQLERERSENSELKMKLNKVESQYNAYHSSEQELVELNGRLKRQLEAASEDLRRTKTVLEATRNEADKVLAQHRAAWSEEKGELQRRVDDVESQLAQLHTKLSQATATHQKRKKKYIKVNTALKDRLRLLKAKCEELLTERDILKKSLPPGDYGDLKKQFRELLRRHREFRAVLLASCVDQVAIGDLSFATVTMPYQTTLGNAAGADFLESEKQHERELDLLKQRLDSLDSQQQHQMAELKGISKSIVMSKVKPSIQLSSDEDSAGPKSD